jgi:hypothetical protein
MMKHLGLEVTKNGDLKPVAPVATSATTTTPMPTLTLASEAKLKNAPSPVSTMSHLDLLQSSIERGELVSNMA